MISDELKYRIREALGVIPTDEQEHAIDVFSLFMSDRDDHVVMILRGSAGTGKTTLAGAIVRAMLTLKQTLSIVASIDRRVLATSRRSISISTAITTHCL